MPGHNKQSSKVFLGIDPGTTRIGFGIIQADQNSFSSIHYGIIAGTTADRIANFANVARSLQQLVKKHRPVAAGIERLFITKNQKTAMAVSEMRGVLLYTLGQYGIPVYEFTPLQVKQTVTGYGLAPKLQIQRVMQILLKIREPIVPDDAADGLAIAICCAVHHGSIYQHER